MINHIIRLSALLVILLTAEAVYAGDSNSTYYSKATATSSGAGTVYVSVNSTDEPNYGETSSASQNTPEASSAPNHEYHFYAQPAEGKTFFGWYDSSNSKVSGASHYVHTLKASSTNENSPTQVNLTASFVDKPYVTVSSNYFEVEIDKFDNTLGQKVTINCTQPWTIEGQVNPSYTFEGWYDQDNTLFSKENKVTFTIDRELDLRAIWTLHPGQLHGNGYYRVANMFHDYVKVVGDEDLSFSGSSGTTAPDLEWFNHPLHYYYRLGNGAAQNNAYADPGIIIYVEGDFNESAALTYDRNKTVVMDNIKMSAQGVVANDHLKGVAKDKPIFITWSAANKNQYHILTKFSGNTLLAIKYKWGENAPDIRANNSDTFDDMHFEAVDLEHIDTNWFGAFPSEDMFYDGGYWSTMYTSFPYQCYEEDGVEAYYISDLFSSETGTTAVITRIEDGIVPPATPVLLKSPKCIDLTGYYKCQGETPEPANRLIPLLPNEELTQKATEIAAVNRLKGVYQLNTGVKVKFDDTMRVLGLGSQGAVGFYKLANVNGEPAELLANRAYLDVSSLGGAASNSIKIITADDPGLAGIRYEEPGDAPSYPAGIYDIYGRKVETMVPGNFYIVNGRKIIVR